MPKNTTVKRTSKTFWFCRTCNTVVSVPEDPSLRCEECYTPRQSVGTAPAAIQHGSRGSYWQPMYNEGLGEVIYSERHRLEVARSKGLEPKC